MCYQIGIFLLVRIYLFSKGQYKYNLANGTDRQSESELQR